MRVVTYYRKSSEDRKSKEEKFGNSIEQQKEWALTVPDVTIVDEFFDQGISGTDTKRRKDFARMIAFCEEQFRLGTPIDAIVCWKANRFSRADSLETMAFLHRLRQAGTAIMVTSEKVIDLNNSQDRMIFGLVQEASDHAYSVNCSTDTKRGKKEAAKAGKYNCRPPFGYKLDAMKKLEVVSEQAEVVRSIFELYLEGKGLRGVGIALAERGIKSPTGKQWTVPTIVSILKNHAYVGRVVHGKRSEAKSIGSVRVTTKRYVHHPRSQWIVTNDAHEAIVTPEQFDRAAQRMAGNRRQTANKDTGFLLSGLLKCGQCGGTMCGRTFKNKRNPRYYVCSNYNANGRALSGCNSNGVPERSLFNAVVKKLEVEFDPDRLRASLVAESQPETPVGPTLAELDAKIAKATERLMDLDDSIFEQFQAKLIALKAERAKLVEQVATVVPVDEQVERAMKLATDFGRALKLGNSAIAKALLVQMIDRIELFFEPQSAEGVRRKTRFVRGWIYVTGMSGQRALALQACDLEPSDKQQELKVRRETVSKLRAQGKTLQFIADALGVAIRTVGKDLTYLAGA